MLNTYNKNLPEIALHTTTRGKSSFS